MKRLLKERVNPSPFFYFVKKERKRYGKINKCLEKLVSLL
nr:MAG TPA: DNA-binding protein inhibitor [Caudoviricetes sp.]